MEVGNIKAFIYLLIFHLGIDLFLCVPWSGAELWKIWTGKYNISAKK